ncbi:DNA polymerase III subunit delta' [Fructilactobacillus vespulae]|uniref:DNA polymerase III subunit delta' n=1 Tax=Fructilactobacillus vespulae TaxID=1249630 RepID=UPI0039B663CB
MEKTQAETLIKEVETNQKELASHFMQVISNQDLSHAYLFSGAAGLGKVALAKMIAMRLFCEHPQTNGFPCGRCNQCIRISAEEHPDVMIVRPDGRSIKIDQIRNLKQEFTKSAVEGDRKVFIIAGADLMTVGAANGLLKFIEEPVGNVNSFLLTDDYHKIIETIQSRTQLVELPKIKPASLVNYAQEKGLVKTSTNLMLKLTSDIHQIDRLCEDDWLAKAKEQIESWFSLVVKGDYRAFTMVQTNLLPLLRDRDDQKIFINMLCLIFQDVFNLKFKHLPAQELAYGNIYIVIERLSFSITDEALLKIINDILVSEQKQKINISFQNILEVITLNCLRTVRG